VPSNQPHIHRVSGSLSPEIKSNIRFNNNGFHVELLEERNCLANIGMDIFGALNVGVTPSSMLRMLSMIHHTSPV
jgi:hypothetical protein